ncbi:MAG: MFS transporter [Elusimicrobiota bacterium]|nr:MAG: MFS transporter [Elusimicrobiota bacterium]
MVEASRRLIAASAPEKPAQDGKSASDEIFSGATPKKPASDSVAAGSQSSNPSGLQPSAPAAAPVPKKLPLVARWKSAVTDGAGPLVVAAFAWNFLTIAAYSIIGPARGALLMTKFGPETLPWVYMASAVLTGLVVVGYNKLAKGASRKKIIGGSLAMLAATLVGGALAVKAAALPAVAFGYYLWTDVFGIMSMTLFWTYQNDVFKRDEAKRSFGLIAAGAPLGSIVGALLMKTLVGSLGPVPMLMVAAVIFAAVLPIFFWMERRAGDRKAADTHSAEDAARPKPAQGIVKTILQSPFLLALTLLVALERLVPDISNYLYSVAAKAAYANDAVGMAQMFADVNFWTSLASFGVSSLLVGLTLKKIGIGGSLMTAGLVNLALFLMFPFMPALALTAMFWGLDGVARYTWFKTAKETSYSATDRDTIYRVKAFIEMFVYRFARGLAGLLLLGVAWAGGGAAAAAIVGVPLALLWLWSAWKVGREHKKLEDANKAAGK